MHSLVFFHGGVISSFGADRTPSDNIYHSDSRIRKSQIIGYLAACLGYDKYDDNYLNNLKELYDEISLSYISLKENSSKMMDFQTIFHVPKNDKHFFMYRKEELNILSKEKESENRVVEKEYYSDKLFLISIFSENEELLLKIKEKIEQPLYLPFVGRKSNSLSYFPFPIILNEKNIENSYISYFDKKKDIFDMFFIKIEDSYDLFFDASLLDNTINEVEKRFFRSDSFNFINNQIERCSRVEYLNILKKEI